MSQQDFYIKPVDTLSFRGNRLFGAAGSFGETRFPPQPSVLAGAFRSLLLAQAPDEIPRFSAGESISDAELADILGTLEHPGSFTLRGSTAARRTRDDQIERFFPMPADLLITNEGQSITRLAPCELPPEIKTSQIGVLSCLPVLRQAKASKPESGWLLSEQGMRAHLDGKIPEPSQLINSSELWKTEVRVGIGMDAATRSVEDGKLFSVEHVAPRQPENDGTETGLLVSLEGGAERLPERAMLRLGGDGRSATIERVSVEPLVLPFDAIQSEGRFRLILQTPGLFQQGWLPDLLEIHDDHCRLEYGSVSARLVCAVVGRGEIVSGWDLARRTPKDALRSVPAGAVYWFDQLEGDSGDLRKLAAEGLWGDFAEDADAAMKSRRVEGYNRVAFGRWASSAD